MPRLASDNTGGVSTMDGRGRARDNIFSERLWRTVKYEEVYLNEYATARARVAQVLHALAEGLSLQVTARVFDLPDSTVHT